MTGTRPWASIVTFAAMIPVVALTPGFRVGAGEGNRTLMTSLEDRGSGAALSGSDIVAGLGC